MKAGIVQILCSYKPIRKILLYGSRARGDEAERSDIDLAVLDPSWTEVDIGEANYLLNEKLSTALKFDLVHWDTLLRDVLKKNILEEGVVLYESKEIR